VYYAFQEDLSPTVPVPTPFEVQGQGEKLQLTEDTRLAAQEMFELGLNQVSKPNIHESSQEQHLSGIHKDLKIQGL